ncbi:MAG: OmpH family outer membrane protein [Deltaproteobacteria bacterium]|nr:OmpH family outer membrane protein [Deltaproteobacteria bacterium]
MKLSKLSPYLVLFAVVVLPAFFSRTDAALAQGAITDEPIYVVDMQKVINESIIGKAARNNVEEEMKKKRLLLEKMKLEVDKLKEDLAKQSTLLSKDALEKKQEALLRKQRDFERAYQDQRDELARKNYDAMTKIVKEIDAIVAKLADEKQYRMVLEKDSRAVLYVNNRYDISEEVIKRINAEKVGL